MTLCLKNYKSAPILKHRRMCSNVNKDLGHRAKVKDLVPEGTDPHQA